VIERTDVKGDSAFSGVSTVFADLLAEQPGTGAQLSIRSGRAMVVSLSGGDDGWGRPWTPRTSVNLWSVSKALGVSVLASFASSSNFSLADDVSRWWPELNAGESLTVADLLSHRAGLVGLRRPVVHSDLLDWPALAREIETTEPWWRPGDGFGYHAWTFGLFVNELIRRVGGVGLEDALRARFTTYADLSALSFEASPAGGVARQIRLGAPPSESALWLSEATDPTVLASLRNPVFSEVEANAAWWEQLVLPSAKAYASADGLTAMMSALLDPTGPVPAEQAKLMMSGAGRGIC
jgi:CubicO group peptidase (beta-lactamase class C family)